MLLNELTGNTQSRIVGHRPTISTSIYSGAARIMDDKTGDERETMPDRIGGSQNGEDQAIVSPR